MKTLLAIPILFAAIFLSGCGKGPSDSTLPPIPSEPKGKEKVAFNNALGKIGEARRKKDYEGIARLFGELEKAGTAFAADSSETGWVHTYRGYVELYVKESPRKAISELELGAEILGRIYGKAHFELTVPLVGLSDAYERAGDAEKAIATIQRFLNLLWNSLEEDDPKLVYLLKDYPEKFERLGRSDLAEALRNKIRKIEGRLYER